MRLLGFEIVRAKALQPPLVNIPGDRGTWWHRIVGEPFTGAWQRNISLRTEDILAFHAVYSCVTLISSDVAKMRIKLVEQDDTGIWSEVRRDSPFLPVLRKPNRYQNRIKFIQQWMISKLLNGNTYVLLERDARGIVIAMHVLDPNRSRPMQSPDGAIYYELSVDALAGIFNSPDGTRILVPASEIIHDMMPALYHPLVGVSPITACYLSATMGINIQQQSLKFFNNSSRPSGVLTAPGHIGEDTAQRFKTYWESQFTGDNVGHVAILGDGLKFEGMMMNAVDAELIKQLELTGKTIASAFHVPAYKVGIEPPPSYNNIGALNQQYYDQCLQTHIEDIELSLDEGLGLTDVPGRTYGTEFDLDGLLRMDPSTQMEMLTKGTGSPILTIDEARRRIDLEPVDGGATIYMQQQNYSLEALAERDKTNPLAVPPQPPQPQVPPPPTNEQEQLDAAAAKQIASWNAVSKWKHLLVSEAA